MNLAIVCFTLNGFILSKQIKEAMEKKGHKVVLFTKSRYLQEEDAFVMEESLKAWTEKRFADKDAILFVGATGIAVRSIAPFIKSKKEDPAVIVLDEGGNYCISLLAGHIGGANEWTLQIAEAVGASPVITTATDVNHLFAVDVFAKKNDLHIADMSIAKEISAALLHREAVGFVSDFPCKGKIPEELNCDSKNNKLGIYIGIKEDKKPFERTLQLIPSCVTLGVGCKRNMEEKMIERRFLELLEERKISLKAIHSVASIDLKADEKGLKDFSEKFNLPFVTFSAEELLELEGEFSSSGFVKSITGVDCVCERAALKKSGGKLFQKKSAGEGVTLAMAVEDRSVYFE